MFDRLGGQEKTHEPPLFRALTSYAPILFLELVEALEDAIFCARSGEGSSRSLPIEQQNQLVREIRQQRVAKGRVSKWTSDARLLGCREQDHPPGWLRARLAEDRLPRSIRMGMETEFAKALVRNCALLRVRSAPEIRRRLSPTES